MKPQRPNDALLTRAEELADMNYGKGVAISFEEPLKGRLNQFFPTEKDNGVTAVVWSKLGKPVLICQPEPTQTKAIQKLIRTLKDDDQWPQSPELARNALEADGVDVDAIVEKVKARVRVVTKQQNQQEKLKAQIHALLESDQEFSVDAMADLIDDRTLELESGAE